MEDDGPSGVIEWFHDQDITLYLIDHPYREILNTIIIILNNERWVGFMSGRVHEGTPD